MVLLCAPFLRCSVFFVLLCVWGLGAGFTKQQWIEGIQSLEAEYYRYQNQHDDDGMASLHTDDVIMMIPGFPAFYGLKGYREVREGIHRFKVTSNEFLFHTDKFAVNRFELELKSTPDSDVKIGKGVAILENIEGSPLISLSIWNYNL